MKFGDLKLVFAHEMKKAQETANKKTVSFVITAYKKVLKVVDLQYTDKESVTLSKINALPVTDHMKTKLFELSKKPIPRELKDVKKVEQLWLDLSNLLGIGNKKIRELLDAGLTNIRQLKLKKYFNMLNADTQLMVEYAPLRKVPHADIKKIESKIVSFRGAVVQIVGSFRRKAPFSKDIDVLVKSGDRDVLDKYLLHLGKQFKNIHVYSQGDDRISLIIQPFPKESMMYKLDVFRSSPENYYSHLLYSSGPKEFNIRMRGKAKRMGFLLNQNGIFEKRNGKLHKVNHPDDDERALFAYLDMAYLPPEKRI